MVESCVRVINDATPFLPRYHHRWTAARMGYYVLRTARRRQLPTHNIEVRRPHYHLYITLGYYDNDSDIFVHRHHTALQMF